MYARPETVVPPGSRADRGRHHRAGAALRRHDVSAGQAGRRRSGCGTGHPLPVPHPDRCHTGASPWSPVRPIKPCLSPYPFPCRFYPRRRYRVRNFCSRRPRSHRPRGHRPRCRRPGVADRRPAGRRITGGTSAVDAGDHRVAGRVVEPEDHRHRVGPLVRAGDAEPGRAAGRQSVVLVGRPDGDLAAGLPPHASGALADPLVAGEGELQPPVVDARPAGVARRSRRAAKRPTGVPAQLVADLAPTGPPHPRRGPAPAIRSPRRLAAGRSGGSPRMAHPDETRPRPSSAAATSTASPRRRTHGAARSGPRSRDQPRGARRDVRGRGGAATGRAGGPRRRRSTDRSGRGARAGPGSAAGCGARRGGDPSPSARGPGGMTHDNPTAAASVPATSALVGRSPGRFARQRRHRSTTSARQPGQAAAAAPARRTGGRAASAVVVAAPATAAGRSATR